MYQMWPNCYMISKKYKIKSTLMHTSCWNIGSWYMNNKWSFCSKIAQVFSTARLLNHWHFKYLKTQLHGCRHTITRVNNIMNKILSFLLHYNVQRYQILLTKYPKNVYAHTENAETEVWKQRKPPQNDLRLILWPEFLPVKLFISPRNCTRNFF